MGLISKLKRGKAKVAQVLEVPKDVALGDAIITLTGKNEVLIENYKGILEYTDTYIKIITNSGAIELVGNNFYIAYLTNEEIKVMGNIQDINY